MPSLSKFFEWYSNQELQERQRGEKFGLPKVDRAARIKSYAKYGYLAHFGNLGGSGDRFSNDRYVSKHEFRWETPSGVYGYPLDLMADNVIKNAVPFAAESPYIYILKVHHPEKLLNLREYDDPELAADLEKLKGMFDPAIFADTLKRYRNYNAPEQIVYMTNTLSGRNPHKWSSILRKLGYVGIYDPEYGIIHENEPTQVVLFGPDVFEVVDKIENNPGSQERNYELASSPNTDARTLGKLAALQDGELSSLIAKNPNANERTLRKIFSDFPWPGVAMSLLINPKLPADMIEPAIAVLEKRARFLLSGIARSAVSQKVIQALLARNNHNINSGLVGNLNVPDATIAGLFQIGPITWDFMAELSSRPKISPQLYQMVWPSLSPKNKINIAFRDDFPVLADDQKTLSTYFQDVLAAANDPVDYVNILRREKLPPEALMQIAAKVQSNTSWNVHQLKQVYEPMFEQENATEVIRALVQSAPEIVKILMASSDQTPVDVLEQLVAENSMDLLYALVHNSKSTPKIFQAILAKQPPENPDDQSVLKIAKKAAARKLGVAPPLTESLVNFYARLY